MCVCVCVCVIVLMRASIKMFSSNIKRLYRTYFFSFSLKLEIRNCNASHIFGGSGGF